MSKTSQTRRLARRRSETLLTMLETLPGALFVVDDDTTIVFANTRAQAMTGATREQLPGKPLWRGASQLVSTALYQAVQKVKQTREPTETAYASPVTNTWLHVSLSPTDEGLALFFQEPLEPPPLQDASSQSEQTYRDLLESFSDGVTIVTPDGLILDINQRPLADAHLQREEVVGTPFTDLPAWSYDPAVQEHLRAAIARASQGETVRFEARIHPRTDLYLDIVMTITSHRDANQQVEYLICAGQDITERKHAEDELRTLVDAIPQFVWIAGPDGSLTYNNQRLIDYLAMTHEQAEGAGWLASVHPDERPRVWQAWQTSIQTGKPYEVEHRMRDGTSGAYRWFLVRGVPQRDAQGTILHWVGTCTDIHDKKQAEDELRVLADAIPQLVWMMRPDGSAEYGNQRWCTYTGMTSQQYQGDGWLQAIHPDDRQRVLAGWLSAVQAGRPYEAEQRLRNGATGGYRWFLARGAPFKDAQGTILKYFGTSTDIEEQKRVEQQLKESEQNWQMLAETVPQLVWTTRPDGWVEYWNQQWYDYTGSSLEQALGQRWSQFLHPDDYERTLTIWHHALASGEAYEIEYRLKEGQTGAYRWFLARGMPVRDNAGPIVKWFGTCTDIEDQKRVEQQLKESEENLRVLAETVPQLVWTRRPDGQFEYTNQRWRDYSGLTREHMQGDKWAQLRFLHPDDQEGNRALLQHALDTGEMYEHEQRLRNSQTGAYRWFLARALPVRDDTGRIVKWFGTATDIEDQKRIEEALRESQERVNILMNSRIIGIFFAEGEQIVDANDTYLRMTGYTREDLCAGHINWLRMTPPEYLARTQQARQELFIQQFGTPYEKEYVCKDGSRIPVVVGVVALRRDPLRHTIGFMLDNSARKELEQRKDAFISMASHELRNPLTALKLHTTLLQRQLTRQGLQAPALSSMETQINKLTRLVEDLLDVSKIQAGRLEYVRETVDLDALLREIADTMQQTSPSHTIVVHGTVGTSLIGDSDRLGQVFTNLVSNAIKYSPDAETVEIDLSTSEEAVTVRVRDHGLGIPREQRDKIFERFYRVTGSRMRAISGLGMGLYIVAEIVKGHGGSITVDSDVGKGSTFTVTLPTRNVQ